MLLAKLLILDIHTLPLETEPWVLTKILSSFLLGEGLYMSEKTKEKISFLVK